MLTSRYQELREIQPNGYPPVDAIRVLLRTSWQLQMSTGSTANDTGYSVPMVAKCIRLARRSGLCTWPDVANLDSAELAAVLFPPKIPGKRVAPDLRSVRDRVQAGDTVTSQWLQYVRAHAGQPPYRYAHFVKLYRDWTSAYKGCQAAEQVFP